MSKNVKFGPQIHLCLAIGIKEQVLSTKGNRLEIFSFARCRHFFNSLLLDMSLLRWVVVGFLTTGVDYVFFLIFYKNLNSVFLANLLSGVIATSVNYFSHHKWTFKSVRSHSSSGPRYFMSLAFWWICSTFLIEWLIDSGMNAELAKLVPAFILLPLNYLVLNRLVFRKLK